VPRPPYARPLRFLLLSIGALLGPVGLVQAQAPADSTRRPADSLAVDSLRARLERAEAAIALLRGQLATENESAVHTQSRVRLELSAFVLANAFSTWGRANNVDVPQTALAPAPPGSRPPTDYSTGFILRQSRFGAAMSVTDILGGVAAGDVDFDLYGGVQAGPGDRRLFPEPRLRTARMRLIWPRTEVMVGAETPLISDLNPVSVAAVGIPVFSGAGNLWNWLGQLRVTQELARAGTGARQVSVRAQLAVMSPYAGQIAPGEPDVIDAGERSGRPAVEGRMSFRWSDADEPSTIIGGLIGAPGGEIGVGGHRGWIAVPGGTATSEAVSFDVQAALTRWLELRGEAYAGRLLRGLGGGAIAQNFGTPPPDAPVGTLGAPLRDVAGWVQVNVQPHPVVLSGVACGIDLVDPDGDPVRRQNTVCAVHTTWRPVQPVVIGVEYRQYGTRYTAVGTHGVRHLNFAFGFEL